MPSSIDDLRIWKHSHGTSKTAPELNGRREQLIEDRVIKIYRDTDRKRGQGVSFRNEMKPRDFFYLCHGNDAQLLGQVMSRLKSPKARWVKRKYRVIRFRLKRKPSHFEGHRKSWSPAGNTTCWAVPSDELHEFEKDILRPFFGVNRQDLLNISRPASKVGHLDQFEGTDEEAPPYLRAQQPYKASRLSRPDFREGNRHVRLYDPDKTGSRKIAHDRCLHRLAQLFPSRLEKKVGDYDLLVVKPPRNLLVEAKTIRDDANDQVREAVGQLLYYEYFFITSPNPRSRVFRLVLTDAKPPSYLCEFLGRYHIGIVWLPVDGKSGRSTLGERLLKAFNARLP